MALPPISMLFLIIEEYGANIKSSKGHHPTTRGNSRAQHATPAPTCLQYSKKNRRPCILRLRTFYEVYFSMQVALLQQALRLSRMLLVLDGVPRVCRQQEDFMDDPAEKVSPFVRIIVSWV